MPRTSRRAAPPPSPHAPAVPAWPVGPGRRGRHGRTVAAALTACATLAALAAVQPASARPTAPATQAAVTVAVDGEYTQRFLELYDKIHDPANGYFSPQGIPYHAVETLMVEAPDYGHETTSEAYSFWLWLETSYGQVTGDWEPFNHAWDTLEQYMIPTTENQPTNAAYSPNSPATYAAEHNHPSAYPSQITTGVTTGKDPIGAELRQTYGTPEIYGMHWLADVDNVYGFGAAPGSSTLLGPDHEGTSYINTFQRGPQESVWETIPQPSIDDFSFGGENGYLDLFTGDASYAKQWKYTNAPDADARAVEAAYWANKFATEQGQPEAVAETVGKASKMGDYLRYALFDKYFKTPGCASTSCAAGTGKDSAHYLLSWYYAWGGALDTASPWAWRIGSSHAHFGYQNPMAAWALANDPALEPSSPTAADDWSKSLDRQVELFQWLQAPEGGIAGGATNSWDGAYAARPAGTPTFYGMAYTEAPVYHDPPSNQWMGMQGWGMERIAQLYHETGDERAEDILDGWVPWVVDNITVTDDSWQIPSELTWTGKPDTWDPANPGDNSGLSVSVKSYGQDVGVAGALARTLMYYGRHRRPGDGARPARRDLGAEQRPGRRRDRRDPRRLRSLRRRPDLSHRERHVRPRGLVRHDAERRRDRAGRLVPRHPLLLPRRPRLGQGPGAPRRRSRAPVPVPPLLGADGGRDGARGLRPAVRRGRPAGGGHRGAQRPDGPRGHGADGHDGLARVGGVHGRHARERVHGAS
jgi:hypothetical protein